MKLNALVEKRNYLIYVSLKHVLVEILDPLLKFIDKMTKTDFIFSCKNFIKVKITVNFICKNQKKIHLLKSRPQVELKLLNDSSLIINFPNKSTGVMITILEASKKRTRSSLEATSFQSS